MLLTKAYLIKDMLFLCPKTTNQTNKKGECVMKIYTLTQPRLLTVTNQVDEPQYVEGIPYSLQQKLNIGKSLVVKNYKGILVVVTMKREIVGKKANEIIRVINGYSKGNCMFYR